MKKIYWIFILVALFLVSSNLVFGQESKQSSQADSSISSTVEYQLPYPGILPDNSLYFLKAFRDKVVEFLISDPLKKAEFNLLEADKRLNAGLYVFEKGKPDLAESTISKGENYFGEAITEAKNAKAQGMDVSDISRKLFTAADKHEEILNYLESKTDGNKKSKFSSIKKRVSEFKNQADSLKPK